MSDNYMDDDSDYNEIEDQQDPGDIKSLRRAANSKKQLEKELADARRELAFAKAGIDLNDPKVKYFVKGYDGEMSAAAVRQAAIEAGYVSAATPSAAASESNAMAAATQDRIATASAGAGIEDLSEASALARLQEAMETGGMDAMLDVARQYGIPIGSEM